MSTAIATPQSNSFASGLERIASAHSSLASGSSRSDAAGSNNAYSTGTSAGTDLMTPVHHADVDDHGPEEELTDHEMDDMYAEAESARQRLATIGTRSMQDMKKGKGRERSMTDAKPRPASVILAPPVPSHLPTSIPKQSQPAPAPKAAKSSGSFSSFLRRLTGKAPKNKDKNIPSATISRPAPSMATTPPKPSAPQSRPQVKRQDTAPAVIPPVPRRTTVRQNSMPARPLLHQLDTRDPVRGPQPLSAPSRPPPRAPPAPKEVDPVNIPLPPSPTLSSDVPDLIDFSSPLEPTERLSQRRKQSPMLSLEGFEIEEETDEEADEVRPLAKPLRITVGSSHRSISPESAPLRSASSAETTIRTPSSVVVPAYFPGAGNGSGSESSPEKSAMRLAGSTPPRKAPIGTGQMLDRKESKWRKSVMGISDNVSRKQTTRQPPPSSHDAYMIQQRRMANNRMSCQPTLHNNASIGAGVTSYKSKEEQEMAETFFLA